MFTLPASKALFILPASKASLDLSGWDVTRVTARRVSSSPRSSRQPILTGYAASVCALSRDEPSIAEIGRRASENLKWEYLETATERHVCVSCGKNPSAHSWEYTLQYSLCRRPVSRPARRPLKTTSHNIIVTCWSFRVYDLGQELTVR